LLAVAMLAVVFGAARRRDERESSARLRTLARFVYGACVGICLASLATAAFQLVALPDAESTTTLPIGLPWLGAHFRVDALSAFFLVVVNLGGVSASLYGLGYGLRESEPMRVLPFFPAFLAGMNLVTLADDAFTFLLSWEFMSLASWALVLVQHREEQNRRAASVYIVMASFGTLALVLAFGLLAGSGGAFAFDSVRAAQHSPTVSATVLALVLLGTGSKAGIVPLHVWLPLAHPAAPSHVSALMSGVMTKVAVYGFVRVIFDLLGHTSWWSGSIVLFLGAITAVLGVLYALMQHDLKRLLAYHTVENIGIIFIGLGLALGLQANGLEAAAALAFTAALFHVLNHSLFKSLLFFGAGAVQSSTGERDMERLGGLIHRMPVTSVLFLVGCVAISALPPLNGFVSEWLTFQAVVQSPDLPQWPLRIMVPAAGAMLALSAALAAACFVKAYGITFLGRPRSSAAESAVETDRFSTSSMALLALLCVAAGVLPAFVIDALAPVVHAMVGDYMPPQRSVPWLSIVPIAASRSSYNGLLLFFYLIVSATVTWYILRRLAARSIRRSPAWDCGYPDASAATQYSAASFAQPIRRVYGSVFFRAAERVEMPAPLQPAPAHLVVTVRDLIWDWVYVPLQRGVVALADRLNHLQFLTIRRYLSLVFGALVLLLFVLAVLG
jgi:formate hydrogenlyase subunit 3/multisubunit Na+/H+ antiporter MnhD subunit